MKTPTHSVLSPFAGRGRRSRLALILGAVASAVVILSNRGDVLTATVWPAEAQTKAAPNLILNFRDSVTGYGVASSVTAEDQTTQTRALTVTESAGHGAYLLAPGRHNVQVATGGYHALRTHFDIEPRKQLNVTLWLDPLVLPDELRPEVIASKLRPGYTMLHGHVGDANAGQPLAGARVRLENALVETRTNERGYFLFYAPTPFSNPAQELPKTDNLVVDSRGFKSYRITNVLLVEGDSHFKIALEPGNGITERDRAHKMLRSAEELKNSQSRPPDSAAERNRSPQIETRAAIAAATTNVTVPDTIRVGFNCSCATCSTVQVFTLDTYVRLGLDDEWISSWNSNSLKAGAIAYRSYGAYHVYHPRDPNYDICSTTCCQVIDPNDSASSTDNATAATSGIIVVNSAGTEPFFAEYAAENNDNFCADGFTGSPSASWPCMDDFVDAGTTFNGHGRGMCQWGTQRWAINQAKDWTWIVNHYYNDNGNPSGARSGVLQTPAPDFSVSATPSTQAVAAGGSAGYSVTVVPTNGFTGIVDFSVSGLPGDATASFNPASVDTSGSTTMTITTSATTPAGSYSLQITGLNGALQHTTSVTLVVTNPDFSLSVSPSSRNVKGGKSTSYTATVSASGGFTGVVDFTVNGLPNGATAAFDPSLVSASGSSTMTVTTSAATPKGTVTLTVTGVSGSLQHSSTVSLSVK